MLHGGLSATMGNCCWVREGKSQVSLKKLRGYPSLHSLSMVARADSWFILPITILILMSACTPATPTPQVIQVADRPAPTDEPVLPTPIPTFIPQTATATPTLPSATPVPIEPTSTVAVSCNAVLAALYESASNYCIGQAVGYFCNGGLPPRAEPAGPIANALGAPGALIESALLDMVQPAPLPSNNSGGLVWLRLDTLVQISALLIGDVQVRDVTPDDPSFTAWQSMLVQTSTAESDCDHAPQSALVVQSPVAQPTRLVINGASIDLDGTLVVQTQQNQTIFSLLEGLGRVTVFGQAEAVFPGQELIVSYNPGDFTRPAALPQPAAPLQFARVASLPVQAFDRPVLLPQPGYVVTEGLVNMRAGPDIDAQLIYQVPKGQIISVLGRDTANEWYHVRLGNDETGWMRADLLSRRTGLIERVYDETPAPPQRFGELGSKGRVIVEQGSNLRRAPDTSFPVIQTLPFGTELSLIARSPYSPWVKVDSGGVEGWVALITIETKSAINFLPVEYDVPLPPQPTATPNYGGGHAYPDPSRGY